VRPAGSAEADFQGLRGYSDGDIAHDPEDEITCPGADRG
jgi:hypothetical protein